MKNIIWSNLDIRVEEWQDYIEEIETELGEKLDEYEKMQKITFRKIPAAPHRDRGKRKSVCRYRDLRARLHRPRL